MHLTSEIALQITKKQVPLSFEGYTSIEDEAAQLIAKKHGQLTFPDLEEISTKAAEYFSKHRDSAVQSGDAA